MIPTRQILLTALLLSLMLVACGSSPTPAPTATPTPRPTATPDIITGPLASNADNPVFTVGEAAAWDSGVVFSPRVVLKDGTYHLFYNGSADDTLPTMAIGYAVSTDGRAFTRPTDEPILTGDGRGFDARQVSSGVPLFDGDRWVLYYNAGGGQGSAGKAIGRATASHPAGPWKRDNQPVLLVGRYESKAWDTDYIVPESVLLTDEGYVMYYTSGNRQNGIVAAIGMATSPDGITWTKHGEPVLQPGTEGSWDTVGVWGCTVLQAEDWEMFYTGGGEMGASIGYAVSPDGIHWTKREGNPIFSPRDDPTAADLTPVIQSPSVVMNGSVYVMYYDYGPSFGGIGLAMGNSIP